MNLMKLRNFKVVKLELFFTTLEFLKFIQFVITCDFNSTDPPNELSLVVYVPKNLNLLKLQKEYFNTHLKFLQPR
jgi:hypothetical protein